MTSDDRVTFVEIVGVLAETFDASVSEARLEAYFAALSDLTIEEVARSSSTWLQTGKFFPKPSELRELVKGIATDLGLAAWRELTSEIRRVGWYGTPKLSEATTAAMRATWGSWQAVCEGLPAPGSTQYDFEHKRFLQHFTASARREVLVAGPSPSEAKSILASLSTGPKRIEGAQR